MPIPLILALILAYGLPSSAPGRGSWTTLASAALMVAGSGLLGVLAGRLLGRWAARNPGRIFALHCRLTRTSRVLEGANLAAFAWLVHDQGWPAWLLTRLGDRVPLLPEILALAPFVAGQVLLWAGLLRAEHSLRQVGVGGPAGEGPAPALWRRIRGTYGLVLPAVFLFLGGNELLVRLWPGLLNSPYAMLALTALMAVLILAVAPLFIRLAWPAHPLPPGPLRDRLECLARRLNFRYSEILVWETGDTLVNAGVTGAFPWLRYVLLSDALISGLDNRQVEAVFGHEVGHIAHRHLGFFGFFFVASLGIAALVGQGLDRLALAGAAVGGPLLGSSPALSVAEALAAAAGVVLLAAYVLLVFGHLSRRFERQADVYGCLAISCDRPDCPPHEAAAPAVLTAAPESALCPVGVHIFSEALAQVAALNGFAVNARSWRHGSVGRRIAFLQTLAGQPEALQRFQKGVRRLRWGLATLLLAGLALAAASGALETL